jgi:hypothetical protein
MRLFKMKFMLKVIVSKTRRLKKGLFTTRPHIIEPYSAFNIMKIRF